MWNVDCGNRKSKSREETKAKTEKSETKEWWKKMLNKHHKMYRAGKIKRRDEP